MSTGIRRAVCLLFLGILFLPGIAQQYKAVFPYRLVGGKMLVNMSVNGQEQVFIFDTGGQTALPEELCRELGLQVFDSLEVTDVNSRKAMYKRVVIPSLLTADGKIDFKNLPAMILPGANPFVCFGADGLIGSDLLGNLIVEIDGRTKTITLMSAEQPANVSLRKMLPFVQRKIPVVALQAGPGNSITCLFDTGSAAFFSLKKSDYGRLKESGAFRLLSEGYGEGSIGVAGMAATANVQRVELPILSVGGTKFRNVSSETAEPPYSLLGVALLEYGKVTLDYPRAHFYFEAYDSENDLKRGHYPVALRVKDGNLVISTVWKEMEGQVQVGDKVMEINGKPTGKYDFCESIINGIPELKKKKKTRLTVRTAGGEKVIIYQKR